MSATKESIVRVRVKSPDVDTFVERFARNVKRASIFLPSREARPVGSEVRFEIRLVDGQLAFSGEGTVSWVHEHDPLQPTRVPGLGVRFTTVDPESRPVLERLVAQRERLDRGASTSTADSNASSNDSGSLSAASINTMSVAGELAVSEPAVVAAPAAVSEPAVAAAVAVSEPAVAAAAAEPAAPPAFQETPSVTLVTRVETSKSVGGPAMAAPTAAEPSAPPSLETPAPPLPAIPAVPSGSLPTSGAESAAAVAVPTSTAEREAIPSSRGSERSVEGPAPTARKGGILRGLSGLAMAAGAVLFLTRGSDGRPGPAPASEAPAGATTVVPLEHAPLPSARPAPRPERHEPNELSSTNAPSSPTPSAAPVATDPKPAEATAVQEVALARIGPSGTEVDEISTGPTYERFRCGEAATAFSLHANPMVNVCFRVVRVSEDMSLGVVWEHDGAPFLRTTMRIPGGRPVYRTRAYLPLFRERVGSWTVRVVSSKGVELARTSFHVTP